MRTRMQPQTEVIIKRQHEEDRLQRQVVQEFAWRKTDEAVMFAVANGDLRNISVAMRLKDQGVLPGASDLVVLTSIGAHFLELKALKGVQNANQIHFEAKVKILGMPYAIARSIDEAIEILDRWGALKHAR